MKNKKYNPMSEEFKKECKRLGLTGCELINKYKKEGNIISNAKALDKQQRVIDAGCKNWKEYKDKCAQNKGFDNFNDFRKNWRHETGQQLPIEDTEDSVYFGDYTENLIFQTFIDAKRMPYGNPGFDYICKDGLKIDNKSACLKYDYNGTNWSGWIFAIKRNNIAEYFILSAWDNRDSLNPLHVWAFHRNDIVRGSPFWNRATITITNTPKRLKEFEKYEVTNRLYMLVDICNKKR